MADRAMNALNRRMDDVNARLKATLKRDPEHQLADVEKTIIIATATIVEAIWKARA